MGMIMHVLLSGGPSNSCFCPGIPVSQTSIWLANPSKETSWPIFFSPPLERILFKSLYRIPGGNHLCTYLLMHLLLLLACEHLECRSIPIHLYIPGSGTCVLSEEMNEWTDQSITFDLWLVVVVQLLSLVWLCNYMGSNTSGFPVHHYLPELSQTHVHWVGDVIQQSEPLLSPFPPAFSFS